MWARPRGTTCASSRRGKSVGVSGGESGGGLMWTERAPMVSGLKRPPWSRAWSWDLMCVSMGMKASVRGEKSRGSGAFGSRGELEAASGSKFFCLPPVTRLELP